MICLGERKGRGRKYIIMGGGGEKQDEGKGNPSVLPPAVADGRLQERAGSKVQEPYNGSEEKLNREKQNCLPVLFIMLNNFWD